MKQSPARKDARRDQRPGELVMRLLARLTRSGNAPQAALSPPGSRSGRGASSVEPYLSHSRGTRPGKLD